MTNSIIFTATSKTVTANRYVPHAIYVKNEALIKELGGEILKGVGGFKATFKKAADAKKFVAQAITEMSEKEYNATRKSKSKAGSKGKAKETEMVALTDAKGNEYLVPASALQTKGNKKPSRTGKGIAPTASRTTAEGNKKSSRTGKGIALSPAAQKALDKMKMSVLNHAASAYSIANGGEATTFSALGKSEKELKDFMPKAKEGLLKSSKWVKAVSAYGLTEEMLG